MTQRGDEQLIEFFSGKKVLSFILAGGEGARLQPLTRDRAKPGVPFGGRYRLLDIVLSNFVNSGLYKIIVLTQYKSDSLHRHIRRHWYLSSMVGQYIETLPAQMRVGKDWYLGSANAVYQNLYILNDEGPEYVAVFGGDHIYHMDIRQMIEFHIEKGAELTVAGISYPRSEASSFGICEVNEDWKMVGFQEKPSDPRPIPGLPDRALVSMGNYIFNAQILKEVLEEDANDKSSTHDFGRDIIPRLVERGKTYVYDFNDNNIPGDPHPGGVNYWRDVGSLDSYFEASMDLVSVSPPFNLYNRNWPILAASKNLPPAKFVFANEKEGRVGHALDSMIGEGCIISGGKVIDSLLFPNVRVNSFSSVKNSVIFDSVNIGRYCQIKNAIIDKFVKIPAGSVIGYDLEKDKQKYKVTEKGIVVISKEEYIPKDPDFKPRDPLDDEDDD